MTATEHFEYCWRATVVTCISCLLAFMVGFLVSDREVGDE